MITLLYAFSVIFALITVNRAKNIFGTYLNHYTLSNISWHFFIFISIYYNNYIRPVTSEVYLIFIVGQLVYNSTAYFTGKMNYSKIEIPVLSLKRRRILEIVAFSFLIPSAYMNWKLIQSGIELWQLNAAYWETQRDGGLGYWTLQFQQVILAPFAMFLMGTSFYSVYKDNRKSSVIINVILLFIIGVCYMIIQGGGRSQVMNVMYIVALSFLASRVNKFSIFTVKLNTQFLILLFVSGVVLLSWANVGRGKSNDFIQEALNGQIIFAPLFEVYYLKSDVFKQYMLGCSMFEPFIALLQYPFKLLFDIQFYHIYNNDYVQDSVYVGALGKMYNAGVSCYWYYMRDFGYFGILLGPIITAYIYNLLYKFCAANALYMIFYVCFILKSCLSTGYPFGKLFWITFLIMIFLNRFLLSKQNVLITYK